MPELELQRLAEIYEKRGLKKETVFTVARELTEKDALGAHIRDEWGSNEMSQAKPIQAALASGAALSIGGLLPFLVTLLLPLKSMEYSLDGFALFFLLVIGAMAAKTRGLKYWESGFRNYFLGNRGQGINGFGGITV